MRNKISRLDERYELLRPYTLKALADRRDALRRRCVALGRHLPLAGPAQSFVRPGAWISHLVLTEAIRQGLAACGCALPPTDRPCTSGTYAPSPTPVTS